VAADASSASGGPTGRVVAEGRDRGSAFALAPRLVVTANHVVRDVSGWPVTFVPDGGEPIRARRIDGDDVLDVAVLELERDVERTLPMGVAAGRPAWRIETRPRSSDPVLSGRVVHTARPVVNAGGSEVELIQLHVDQQLGDYRGYSGSPVMLESPRGAVIGVLVEQQRWRLTPMPGQPVPVANVLYATPIASVTRRFGIGDAVLLAHPQRFDVPRPPIGLVERPLLLNHLLSTLARSGPSVVLLRGMPGMGKTVLAREAAHHSLVWRAFPGGVLEHVVGEDRDADEVLRSLGGRLGAGTGAISYCFPDASTLVILDDVWSEEIVSAVRNNLPDSVRLLATTRGVRVSGAAVVGVDELTKDEAINLLARTTASNGEVEAALDRLAKVLGRWPLLVDLAARHLHGDELASEQTFADVDADVPPAVAPAELAHGAEAMASAFEHDPTLLDEADSRRRSFDRMLRRSLERLSSEAKTSFSELAVYPADADLAQSLLADLWQLDLIRARKTIGVLTRVGLATLIRTAPPTLRLHDLVAAWLHQQFGNPDAPEHRELHLRCARPALTAQDTPRELTEERAAWLAFHLCRTGRPGDPVALLTPNWRRAYRTATGSDAPYLAGLREIGRHHAQQLGDGGGHDDVTRTQLTAWTIKSALIHAHVSALVGEVPAAVLVAQAVLQQTNAAVLQAASNPDADEAGAALLEIFVALHDDEKLLPHVLDLLTRQVQGLQGAVRDEILGMMALKLAPTDPDAALALADAIRREPRRDEPLAGISAALATTDPDRALGVARRISDATRRGDALADIAELLAAFDPERALAIAEALPIDAELRIAMPTDRMHRRWLTHSSATSRAPGLRRGYTLAVVAAALATVDPERSRRLSSDAHRILDAAVDAIETVAPSSFHGPSEILSRVAHALAPVDKAYARSVLERSLIAANRTPFARSQALTDIARVLTDIDSEQARSVLDRALAAVDHEFHLDQSLLLIDIAQVMREVNPGGARRVLDRALALAQGDMFFLHESVTTLVEIAEVLGDADPELARTAFDAALEAASNDSPGFQSSTLADIASAVTVIDNDWAAAVAREIPESLARSSALAAVARSLAETDLDGALGVVREIPDQTQRSTMLAMVARRIAPSNPDRARELLDAAISVAEVLPVTAPHVEALSALLAALAPADPRRAVAIAERISIDQGGDRALIRIADALARIDHAQGRRLLDQVVARAGPGASDLVLRDLAVAGMGIDAERALEIAERIGKGETRNEALAEIGGALAATDPDVAGRLINRAIENMSDFGVGTIARVLRALAPLDAERALAIAAQVAPDRGEVLAAIAEGVAPVDPQRALAIVEPVRHDAARGRAMAAIAAPLLPIDPECALAIPMQIPRSARSRARIDLARALARTDFERALAVAGQIGDESIRAEALGHLAGRSGNRSVLLAGLAQSWSHIAPSLRFADALVRAQQLPQDRLELVATPVFDVLEWFQASQVSGDVT
jgi:NB-ARC domain